MSATIGCSTSLIFSSMSRSSKTSSTSTIDYLISLQKVPKKFKGAYI
jgi:hypothetical protein